MPVCFSVEVVFQLRCVDEVAIMSGANAILVRSSAKPLRERKASGKPISRSRDSQSIYQLTSESKHISEKTYRGVHKERLCFGVG